MAIIKLGGTVVGIRGTVGGLTFSANKGGTYCKSWSRGSNPRSQRQQVRRGILASMGPAWAALSGAQQTDWDALAATDPEPHTNSLGEPITFSGYGLFSMFNQRRVAAAFSILQDAPTGTEATQPTAITIDTFDPHTDDLLTWLDWTIASGPLTERLPTFLALVPSDKRVPGVSERRFVFNFPAQTPPVTNFPFVTEFWGTDIVGWNCKVWCYRQRASGIRSVVATALAVVTG